MVGFGRAADQSPAGRGSDTGFQNPADYRHSFSGVAAVSADRHPAQCLSGGLQYDPHPPLRWRPGSGGIAAAQAGHGLQPHRALWVHDRHRPDVLQRPGSVRLLPHPDDSTISGDRLTRSAKIGGSLSAVVADTVSYLLCLANAVKLTHVSELLRNQAVAHGDIKRVPFI